MSNRSDTALGLDARKGIAGRVARWALYALVVFVFAGPLVALLLHVSITGSLLGMIVPVGAWAVSIVVMTEFMKEIPIELEEAARIDGAGELRVFGSVILPLCRPALGIVGILGFAMIWDQYML